MNEREAFVRGIAADLYDDTPRLAFADWLDEHGEHDRAEFIRVQCELEPMRDQYEIPRAAELHARESELLRAGNWLGPVPADWDEWRGEVFVEFYRGFPDLLRLPARRFISDGESLRACFPTLRRLVVHCFNGRGKDFAGRAALRGVPELELACWYSEDDLKALAASPHLSELQVLVLWLSARVESSIERSIVRLAMKAKAWPKLRELVLFDVEGTSEPRIKKLATSANRSAKRKVARYERGYPELFPLDRDFHHSFPVAGRLPDGRAAVLDLDSGKVADYTTAPNGFLVRTFDASGAPADVIRVPLPSELATVKLGDATYNNKPYLKHLSETLGFVPGFIRVREGAIDDYYGPWRGNYESWDLCGDADDPERPTDYNGDYEPLGVGGIIYCFIHNIEFVSGHSAWLDKRGKVHST